MATLLLAVGGSALGTSLGLSTAGSALLATAGSFAGSYIDNAILGVGKTGSRTASAPLQQLDLMTSSYGRMIPVVYGTARVAGNVLWLSTPVQRTVTQTQNVRTGKFSSKNVTSAVQRYVEADMAIAFAAVPSLFAAGAGQSETSEDDEIRYKTRGTALAIRRLWADGQLIYDARTSNLSVQQTNNFVLAEFYDGSEDQLPDSVIESHAGAGQVPAFRGTCYALLQQFRLSDYGNRVPNIQAELMSSLPRVYTEASPAAAALLADGTIVVANGVRRTVSIIDGADLKPLRTIGRVGVESEYLGTLPAQPTGLAVRSADNSVWVCCKGDAAVLRLNPLTGAVVATIPVGYYPESITIDAAGNPWVTFPTRNKVARLNPATNTVAAEYDVTSAPQSICLGLDGSLWVSAADAVVRLNAATGAEIARVSVGLFPWGVACNPVSGEIWVALSGQDVLQVIDPATNTVVKTRNTGTYPTAVSCHPNDPMGSVAVTLLYGNQLKLYSRQYSEMLEIPTVAFPGACVHGADGRVVVGQSQYDFVLVAEGRG
jgi:YVTN family beta-propeller protein